MSVTLSLDISDELAAALGDQAAAEGSPVEDVATTALIAMVRERRPEALIGVVAPLVAANDEDLIKHFRRA